MRYPISNISVTLAAHYFNRMVNCGVIDEEIKRLLNSMDTLDVIKRTFGSAKVKNIARFVVEDLNMTSRAIDKLGAGFLDEIMLDRMNVQEIMSRKHGPIRYSNSLARELINVTAAFIVNSTWYQNNKGLLARDAKYYKTIQLIQDS